MAASEEPANNVCIFDCTGGTSPEIIPQLIGELTGGEGVLGDWPVRWRVDNKYYTADIQLFLTTSWSSDRHYQALVFLCHLDQPVSVESVKSQWDAIQTSDSAPDVRVLLGLVTMETATSEVLQWCVSEGMELIEWDSSSPLPPDTESDDGLPPEAVGVARLSESLQAHVWPNLTMKSRDPTQPQAARPADTDQTLEQLETKATASTSKEDSQKKLDELLLTEEQAASLKDDPGGENFEDLFSRFSAMKAHAETLPHEERKEYAEKVVMAFWSAIGGDEQELTDPN